MGVCRVDIIQVKWNESRVGVYIVRKQAAALVGMSVEVAPIRL